MQEVDFIDIPRSLNDGIVAPRFEGVQFDYKPANTDLAEFVLSSYGDPEHVDAPGVVVAGGEFWVYDPSQGCWQHLARKDAERRIALLRKTQWQAPPNGEGAQPDPGRIALTAARIGDIVKLMIMLAPCRDLQFRGRVPGVVFRNGFLGIGGTGRLTPHSPDNFARWAIDTDYVPWRYQAGHFEGSLLQHFVGSAFEGDDDEATKVKALAEFAFATLFGVATRLKRALLLVGVKGSGKSQTLRLFEAMVPASAVCGVDPALMNVGNQFTVCDLDGKALNVVHELSSRRAFQDEAWFKAIVNGEAISARRIYGENAVVECIAAHAFATNDLPDLGGQVSQAFWDRWLILRFNRTFRRTGQAIQDLGRRIATEELGLLAAWAVEHGADLMDRGDYSLPTEHAANVKRWQDHGDSVATWLAEQTRPARSTAAMNWTRVVEAHTRFIDWCQAGSFEKTSRVDFRRRCQAMGIEIKKSRGQRMSIDIVGEDMGDEPAGEQPRY